MNRTRRPLAVLYCTVLLLLGSLLVPIPAQASSVYDGAIYNIDSLKVVSVDGQHEADVTRNYTAYMEYSDMSNSCDTLYSDYLDHTTNDAYGATLVLNNGANQWIAYIWWGNSEGFTPTWVNDPSGPGLKLVVNVDHTSGGSAVIGIDNSGNVYSYCSHDYMLTDNMVANATLRFYPLFVSSDVDYPDGYAGVIARTSPPGAKYVAMGDSFSSGEGNPTFEVGTDESGTNECHRSPVAYPRLLEADSNLNLGSTAFVACSGATTTSVISGNYGEGNWSEGPQIDALSDDTEVVTITIGGNDVGFSEFATECLFPMNTYIGHEGTCDEFTSIYDNTLLLIDNDLPFLLSDVYESILTEAPNAEIYVIGYPVVAPYMAVGDPFIQECGGLYDEWPNTWGDARAAYDVVNHLNDVIEDTVDTVNVQQSSTRLHYVDVTNGAFFGHDVCSTNSYFNGVYWPYNTEYSIHPNEDGQAAYATDVASVM